MLQRLSIIRRVHHLCASSSRQSFGLRDLLGPDNRRAVIKLLLKVLCPFAFAFFVDLILPPFCSIALYLYKIDAEFRWKRLRSPIWHRPRCLGPFRLGSLRWKRLTGSRYTRRNPDESVAKCRSGKRSGALRMRRQRRLISKRLTRRRHLQKERGKRARRSRLQKEILHPPDQGWSQWPQRSWMFLGVIASNKPIFRLQITSLTTQFVPWPSIEEVKAQRAELFRNRSAVSPPRPRPSRSPPKAVKVSCFGQHSKFSQS